MSSPRNDQQEKLAALQENLMSIYSFFREEKKAKMDKMKNEVDNVMLNANTSIEQKYISLLHIAKDQLAQTSQKGFRIFSGVFSPSRLRLNFIELFNNIFDLKEQLSQHPTYQNKIQQIRIETESEKRETENQDRIYESYAHVSNEENSLTRRENQVLNLKEAVKISDYEVTDEVYRIQFKLISDYIESLERSVKNKNNPSTFS